ncbi:type II secretion system F family protein [Leucobacter sp.]
MSALRCAALLRGGVPPARVFSVLAEDPQAGGAAAEISARVELGEPVTIAIAAGRGPEWRVLAVAWSLAEESGVPLAPALDRIGAALRALERLRERRTVLLAAPRATVRLVSALPPLALVLGWLLGFDPLPVLLSPLGAALLPAGVALLLAGIVWARALRRGVERADRVAGLELELVRIALGGGAHPRVALRRAVDCVDRFGAEWVPLDGFLHERTLRAVIGSAERTGTPLGPMLVEEAAAARTRAEAELERAAERLGVRVLVPLGVCVLPSFIVLGVVPVLVAMLGGA